MDPRNKSTEPKPAEPTLPAKGTTDTQSADSDNGTNLPRPASAPATTEAEESASAADATPTSEAPTDATPSTTSSGGDEDADPSASNTSNDEPL
ncbi:hypothetical protein K3G63_09320 [Hymenobacter sp. HSC-4F20]|uniref:hypothetical protein n=1 Tax=Hymenobacter sp. HSC-4F20 TaxID=2864135 RepID=UPI001C731FA5|nr:hypothetical protein [Hymenobacter sp. HSC-4F20]MBX0290636.1 hypothetical protein [Hymenobacter sp. HSC-4F20]